MEQYQGVIARMFNAGSVQSIHAEVVTMQERLVRHDPMPPTHEVPGDDWLDRDLSVENLKGAYAYAVLEGGVCSRVVIMGRAQIMTHRDVAATMKFWDGKFGLSMWLKTVVHELEKWVPTSASYRKERARADAELAKLLQQAPAPAQPPRERPASGVPDEPLGEPAQAPTEAVSGREEDR
jgi:recombination protein RecT